MTRMINLFRFAYLLTLFFALSALFAASSFGQVDVIKGKPKVQVRALKGSQGKEATRVLVDDLNRTMMMDASTSHSGAFTVTGEFSSGSLQAKLVRANGEELLNQNYSGPWRKATHQLADDITFAITGVTGFAQSQVAFISSQSGHKELYIMDIDGANVRQLTRDSSISNAPSWSYNNKSIAYTSYKSGYPDVYVIDLAKGKRIRVAAFPGINSGPSFSPNDKELALTLSKDGNPEIYVMPATGGTPKRITRTRGAETSPTWSPTGEQIAYSSDERGSPQLLVVPSDGGESRRLRTGSSFNTEPDWSPNETKITYTLRTGGRFQIGVYDFAQRTGQQITKNGGEDSSWTPNSRHLVYANNGSLYILDSVTKQAKRLYNGLKKCSEPAVSH